MCYHLLPLQWKFRYSRSHNAISNFLIKAVNRAFPLQPRPPRLSDQLRVSEASMQKEVSARGQLLITRNLLLEYTDSINETDLELQVKIGSELSKLTRNPGSTCQSSRSKQVHVQILSNWSNIEYHHLMSLFLLVIIIAVVIICCVR